MDYSNLVNAPSAYNSMYSIVLEDLRWSLFEIPRYLSIWYPVPSRCPAPLNATSGLPWLLASGRCHPISPDTNFASDILKPTCVDTRLSVVEGESRYIELFQCKLPTMLPSRRIYIAGNDCCHAISPTRQLQVSTKQSLISLPNTVVACLLHRQDADS